MAEGTEVGTAYVSILPSGQAFAQQLGQQLSGATTAAGDKVEQSLGGAFKKVAGIAAGVFAGTKVIGFLKDSMSAAEESNKIAAQTEAVIKSTGGAANLTAKQFSDLATSISRKTGIDDEAIQSAENLLATFTNIRSEAGKNNDIFQQATKIAVDMGAALGGDASSNAIQLGKALNDPIKGITALTRVGVTFTDQQREQIQAMVAAGDTMGAQRVILGELNREFGGSAEAQATSADKMRVAMGNLQESVGNLLIPVIGKLSEMLTPIIDAFTNAPGPIKVLVGAVGAFAAAVIAVNLASSAWAAVTEAVAAAQAVLNAVLDANPIGLVILAAAGLAAGLVVLWKNSETFRDIVTGAFNVVSGAITGLWNWVSANWPLLLGILTGPFGLAVLAITKNWDTITGAATAAKDWIVARFNDIIGFITGLPGRIASAASGMWNGIHEAFKAAVNGILEFWNSLEFKIPGVDVGPVHLGGFTLGVPDIPLMRDAGGPVAAMRPYLIGRGPELFMPSVSGGIISTPDLAKIADIIGGAGKGAAPVVGELNMYGASITPADISAELSWWSRTSGR